MAVSREDTRDLFYVWLTSIWVWKTKYKGTKETIWTVVRYKAEVVNGLWMKVSRVRFPLGAKYLSSAFLFLYLMKIGIASRQVDDGIIPRRSLACSSLSQLCWFSANQQKAKSRVLREDWLMLSILNWGITRTIVRGTHFKILEPSCSVPAIGNIWF